jgi:hypothetical protein
VGGGGIQTLDKNFTISHICVWNGGTIVVATSHMKEDPMKTVEILSMIAVGGQPGAKHFSDHFRHEKSVVQIMRLIGLRIAMLVRHHTPLRRSVEPLDLTSVNLTDAWMPGATLTGAKLMEATMTDAWMPRANLTGADLSRAWMPGATLTGAKLMEATMTDAWMPGATLTGAKLMEATMTGTIIIREIPRQY